MIDRVVTIRLDQRLRYLVELATRCQRRLTSAFVRDAIKAEITAELGPEAETLWAESASERLAKLAAWDPRLLTVAEACAWKAQREQAQE